MPDRSRRGTPPAPLRVDELEARLTPAGLDAAEYRPDRLLVSVAAVAPPLDRLANLRHAGVASVDPIGAGLVEIGLNPGETVTAAEARLAGVLGVISTQPDYQVAPARLSTDPGAASQWAFNNTGQNGGVAGDDIHAAAAWSVSTGTGNTIVAVIDTGIDAAHPDLAGNLWRNPGEVAGNGLDDDGDGIVDDVNGVDFTTNSGNPADTDGHGTHVAGIIGARGDNGTGVAGVDWRARIMPLKFIGPNGGFTSDAIRAVDYAIAHGAKIINASWGGTASDPALTAAVARARAAGAIVVAAAGNYGADNDATPFYPASVASDNVVSVAATDSSDRLASYSDYGVRSVTLAAPGSDIVSTLPGGRSGSYTGTSMAAPFVSGALALLWDVHPTWGYQQILTKLVTSLDTLPSLIGKTATGGRLDLAKLLDAPGVVVSPPVVPVTPPVVLPVPVSPPTLPIGNDTVAPRLLEGVFGGARAGQIDRVWVRFSEPVDPNSLTRAAFVVAGPAGRLTVSAVIPVAGRGGTQFLLMLGKAQTSAGSYSLVATTDIRDLAGNRLDLTGNRVVQSLTR